MSAQRYRLRYTFWLDMNKPDEEAIANEIELLKNERAFARTIRQGIRLMVELRNHKLDLLLMLFPFILDRIAGLFEEDQREIDQQRAELEQERIRLEHEWWLLEEEKRLLEAERKERDNTIDAVESVMAQQLERIEQMLLEQGNQPVDRAAGSQERRRHMQNHGDKPKITVTESNEGGASEEEIAQNIMNLAKMFG